MSKYISICTHPSNSIRCQAVTQSLIQNVKPEVFKLLQILHQSISVSLPLRGASKEAASSNSPRQMFASYATPSVILGGHFTVKTLVSSLFLMSHTRRTALCPYHHYTHSTAIKLKGAAKG